MIYFDNAAFRELLPKVKNSCEMLLERYSGNPEAAHARGFTLRQELKTLQEKLFSSVVPQAVKYPHQCFFGSDATSLINQLSMVLQNKKQTAWASALDHIANRLMLERTFGKVENMALNKYGIIENLPDSAELPDFIFVTHVQSEIGVRQPLPELMRKLRAAAPQTMILVDMVQSLGMESYPLDAPLPDLLLISGAKIGSGGGAALLAIGGSSGIIQKKFDDLRKKEHLSGNVNMFQAAALTLACQELDMQRQENLAAISRINKYLRCELQNKILPNGGKCTVTVPEDLASPHILHIMLEGYQSGVLVRLFSAENIMVAAGSACEAETREPSAILTRLGYSKNAAFSGLRLSFSEGNTMDEAGTFLRTMEKILKNY